MFKTLKAALKRLFRREADPKRKREAFRVKARPMGLRPGLNLDCVSDLIEQVEGPLYK